jgi:hypothetical protein
MTQAKGLGKIEASSARRWYGFVREKVDPSIYIGIWIQQPRQTHLKL